MADHIIYKYTLDGEPGVTDIPMHAGATVLHVASVNDVVCVWVRVNPDNGPVVRRFVVVGTGQEMEPAVVVGEHIGTAVTLGGKLVWHVFDLGNV